MKQLLVIYLLMCIGCYSFGQLYLQPSAGYTFSSHPKEAESILIADNYKTVFKTRLKFGEGVHVGFKVGFNFTDNFFVELDTRRAIYANYNLSTIQPDLQSFTSGLAAGYFGRINYRSSIFQLAPLAGFRIQKDRFGCYFKVGPNLMKSKINKTLQYADWNFDSNGDWYSKSVTEKTEYKGKLHVGMQANLGVYYAVKQNLQLVLDVVTVYNNYKITTATIRYYEIDGVDHLKDFADTNVNIGADDRWNHSHYGIMIGVNYIFSKGY